VLIGEYHKYLIDCNQQELDAVRTCLQTTCYGCQSEPRPVVRTRQTQGLKEEAQVIDLCDSDIGEVTIVKSLKTTMSDHPTFVPFRMSRLPYPFLVSSMLPSRACYMLFVSIH
jgi:hypothetical protein